MTELAAITDDDARSLFTTIRDNGFTFTATELPALIEHLNWQVTAEVPQRSIVARSDWGLTDARVYITRVDDDVRIISMSLTGALGEPTSETTAFLHDTFARLASLATEILGSPTLQQPGEMPSIRWRLGPTTVILTRLARSVSAAWASTAYQDEEDAYDQDADDE